MKVKKRYTIIIGREEREAVMEYAKTYGRQEALAKFGISIATFKRWHASYNSDDQSRSLQRKYSQPSRIDKYEQPVKVIEGFFNRYKYFLKRKQTLTKQQKKELTEIINSLQNTIRPNLRIWTVYRLIHDVMREKGIQLNLKTNRYV